MKNTTFYWAWNNYEPQHDRLMTRARAANLLACWRRRSRQKSNMEPLKFKRFSRGVYEASVYGEIGRMIISR
jgi:hypothetical protein